MIPAKPAPAWFLLQHDPITTTWFFAAPASDQPAPPPGLRKRFSSREHAIAIASQHGFTVAKLIIGGNGHE